jgi:hypothetical protein
VTAWRGGVNNHLIIIELSSDDNDSDFTDTDMESQLSEDEIDELEGDELVESLQKEIESEIRMLNNLSNENAFTQITMARTKKEWKKIEANRSLGYTGNSVRTQRRHNEAARKKAEKDDGLRKT